jgi:uncharacterized protein (DUF1684 family)
MQRPTRSSLVALLSPLLIAPFAGCARQPSTDPAHVVEVEAWRADRVAELTKEDGWLSLVGLHWLEPGDNTFGGGPDNDIVLPGEHLPQRAGTLELAADGSVFIKPEPGAPLLINGGLPIERLLATDREGTPDTLSLGSLSFYIITRGGQRALRAKDLESPRRMQFQGIDYFPIDQGFRVEGTFEAYDEPHQVQVPAAQGPPSTSTVHGVVRFSIDGQECSLEPFGSSRVLFFVFRDATSGESTYGGGRFLEAPAPDPATGKTTLDFNRAYNPPCAFTPFATCPLPLPQNSLSVAITAGEKTPAGH